ncbi:hypothetical protein D3C72_2449000 [compost metagenome]
MNRNFNNYDFKNTDNSNERCCGKNECFCISKYCKNTVNSLYCVESFLNNFTNYYKYVRLYNILR